MSSGSNIRTSFPAIERALEGDPALSAMLRDLSVSSADIAMQVAGTRNAIGASTIRTWRRNVLQADIAPSEVVDKSVLNASKILCYDIETVPAEAWFWHPRVSYIPWKNITKPGDMLSWAAGWYHEPGQTHYKDRIKWNYEQMLQDLWTLLDEASYVVGWNSDRFDLRKVRGYFARAGFPPFRPPKSIDLMKTAKTFAFESASLGFTAKQFGVTEKIDNGAVASWQDVMAGDEEARDRLELYNRGDVTTTLELYDAMRPWIINHPHIGFAADDAERCPRCGSNDLADAGVIQAVVIRYRQKRCGNCGGLCRSVFHSRASITRAV